MSGHLTVPLAFTLGTGSTLTDQICRRVLEECQREIIFVTCFWAASDSLRALGHLLKQLSKAGIRSGSTYRVRICFSSLSLLQKLTHTRSEDGYTYPSTAYAQKLGLPPVHELLGLELQVKSMFVLPFSVMHPKYVIIDRKVAILPSCNVSWEDWFEGCLEFQGPAVTDLFSHWQTFWGRGDFGLPVVDVPKRNSSMSKLNREGSKRIEVPDISLLLLTSAYHQNPRVQLVPWQVHLPPPSTPLNEHTLRLIAEAQDSIFITTPNITSAPFLHAIVAALARGVGVHVVTNDRLMTLEQIVTAFTTTPRCVAWLKKQHGYLATNNSPSNLTRDLESHGERSMPGDLEILYFRPRSLLSEQRGAEHVPTKLHLKLTIVDKRHLLLGSGNQDRASWYTSQELGVAIDSAEIAAQVFSLVEKELMGNTVKASASRIP